MVHIIRTRSAFKKPERSLESGIARTVVGCVRDGNGPVQLVHVFADEGGRAGHILRDVKFFTMGYVRSPTRLCKSVVAASVESS